MTGRSIEIYKHLVIVLCHFDDPLELNITDTNFAVLHFIIEIQKKSVENYPNETLYEIIICLQLQMAVNAKKIKIFHENDFGQIRNTLDKIEWRIWIK